MILSLRETKRMHHKKRQAKDKEDEVADKKSAKMQLNNGLQLFEIHPSSKNIPPCKSLNHRLLMSFAACSISVLTPQKYIARFCAFHLFQSCTHLTQSLHYITKQFNLFTRQFFHTSSTSSYDSFSSIITFPMHHSSSLYRIVLPCSAYSNDRI